MKGSIDLLSLHRRRRVLAAIGDELFHHQTIKLMGGTPMRFRFVTKTIHAYLIDYPVAGLLIAAPFLLTLGKSGPAAMWLSVVTGIAALLLAALTDHNTGLIRIIPYWLHLWVDRAVGVLFLIAPFAFKFIGLDAWYYWINAGAILLVTSVLNAPEEARSIGANSAHTRRATGAQNSGETFRP